MRQVFVSLYDSGLLYRGKRMINWCPRCMTALANIEVEGEELGGSLYHIRYPLVSGKGALIVATTRPETMLGDTAVAEIRRITGTRPSSGKWWRCQLRAVIFQ